MIKNLLDWFNQNEPEADTHIPTNLAAAALMVEVMAADDDWQQQEEETIKTLLSDSLNIAADQIEQLIKQAKDHHLEANDLYELTKRINDQYSEADKFQLVYHMWQVAFADGDLDRYEDYTIRKISELLYLPHNQFIKAKLQADPNHGEL